MNMCPHLVKCFTKKSIADVKLSKPWGSSYKNGKMYFIKKKKNMFMWVEQNMSTTCNRIGGAGDHTRRHVFETHETAEKHHIPCRYMHERETVMQSGESSAMLVVCVCVCEIQFLHIHCSFWTNHIIFHLSFDTIKPLLYFSGQLQGVWV